jgi:hypothetical protein
LAELEDDGCRKARLEKKKTMELRSGERREIQEKRRNRDEVVVRCG